jgi:hypothetical protein
MILSGGGELQLRAGPGKAVQVEPMEPTLKPPGTKRWNLTYSKPLSSFAFKSNLRHYTLVTLFEGDGANVLATSMDAHGVARAAYPVWRLRVTLGWRMDWRIRILGSRNPPESTQIRLSSESVRIRNLFLWGQKAHSDCKMLQNNPQGVAGNPPEST